jgi:hypothetical protein
MGLLVAVSYKSEFWPFAFNNQQAKNLLIAGAHPSQQDGVPYKRLEIPMQNTLPELITPRTLAARWGLSEKTLERWRMTGTGPTFLKLGSRVLYRMDDVSAHEAHRTRRCTAGQFVSEGIWR